jgi:uncharacterized membrane protein
MPTRFESVKKIGRKIGIDDDKGYVVAIIIALIVLSAVIAGYYLVLKPQAEPYNTMYILDGQKQTVNYPVTSVANQNSTFNLYADVVNHMGQTESYQIQVKITQDASTFPVNAQPAQVLDISSLAADHTSENPVSITENQPGNYVLVFELWQYNDEALIFTHNFCALNLQVTS